MEHYISSRFYKLNHSDFLLNFRSTIINYSKLEAALLNIQHIMVKDNLNRIKLNFSVLYLSKKVISNFRSVCSTIFYEFTFEKKKTVDGQH
jgi:hypothetical protein